MRLLYFKFPSLIALMVVFLSVLSISVYGNDHGDDLASSTLVEVESTIGGEIVETGEIDYFKIILTEETFLSVESLGETDTYGYLLDSSGGILGENDDSYSHNFKIVKKLPAGIYYVQVKGYGGLEKGAYQFYVSRVSDDHGDGLASATLIEVESTTDGEREWAEDVDYFKIVLTQDKSLFWLVGEAWGIQLDLLGSSGAVLRSDIFDGGSDPISMDLTAGTYYFALSGDEWATGSYKLMVSGSIQVAASNDDFASRAPLVSNVEKIGSLKGASSEGYDYTTGLGEPDLSGGAKDGNKDDLTLWYEWTAPSGCQWAKIDLMELEVASALSVYTGGGLHLLTQVGLNHRRLSSFANRLIFPVTPGVSYKIRVAVWSDDYYYSQMPGLDFKLRLSTLYHPVSSADYIFRGRGELSKGTADGLSRAVADFSKALEKEPNSNEARLLHALTSLLNLEHEPEFSQMLSDLGLVKTGVFQEGGRITVPKDIDGDPIPATNATSKMGIDWVKDTFLVRMATVRNELSEITDDQFLIDLTDLEAGGEMIIDKGDVLLLKAMTHGIDMVFNLVFTYDLNLAFEALVEFSKDGSLSAEKTLNTFDSLLSFAATDRRQFFDADIRKMEAAYLEASDFIRNHNGALPRVLSESLSEDADNSVRDSLTTLMTSLNGDPAYLGGRQVNLSRLVATNMSIRDFLPKFGNDEVDPGSLPDPTFGGLLPEMSSREIENVFFKLGSLGSMAQYVEDLQALMNLDPWADPVDAPAPFDDEDGDGQNNFSEWIRGSDPFTRDVIWETLSRSVISPGQVEFTMSFVRRKSLTNWKLEVWVSDDLVNWDQTETQIQMVGLPVDNGDGFSETVTYKLDNAAALSKSKFLQVQSVLKK